MRTLYIVLYVIAGVCFLLAAADVTFTRHGRPFAAVNWLALGLLAWVLVPLIAQIDAANSD